MPCWYYEKKELRNTPSIQDAIDYETECRYRKEGARFIIDSGTKMDLGYSTMATGVVYFHRFYMFHSFRNFPRYVTACCCLFLAGKVEETPKKCKDIIKTARALLSDQKFLTFGDDPKEEVMTLERILLQTIKFDLQVEHPYSYLLKYAKCLKGDKGKLQKMVQMAWTFVNDSLCTTLCLQWEPEVIAVALMYLSGKLSKFEVVDWSGRTSKHLRWWDMFVEDVTMDLLEDICHQVLDLYSQPQPGSTPESPPLQPSTRSPLVKKERTSQPVSPAMPHSPVAAAAPGSQPATAAAAVPAAVTALAAASYSRNHRGAPRSGSPDWEAPLHSESFQGAGMKSSSDFIQPQCIKISQVIPVKVNKAESTLQPQATEVQADKGEVKPPAPQGSEVAFRYSVLKHPAAAAAAAAASYPHSYSSSLAAALASAQAPPLPPPPHPPHLPHTPLPPHQPPLPRLPHPAAGNSTVAAYPPLYPPPLPPSQLFPSGNDPPIFFPPS